MSLKKTTSIFSRTFKRQFNHMKYAHLTNKREEAYSGLRFFSLRDARMGRTAITLALTVYLFYLYTDPAWFHETFGHMHYISAEDDIDKYLDPEERKLNNLLIHREHEEHRLEKFMSTFKDYEEQKTKSQKKNEKKTPDGEMESKKEEYEKNDYI